MAATHACVSCGMIRYTTTIGTPEPEQLAGFFVGWPNPPGPEAHLRILRGSFHVVLAVEGERVVGFVTAISDGVLTAFVPLLEVLPEYQGRGIGTELMRRMTDDLSNLYSLDLVCDEDLVPFYEKLGWRTTRAMSRRNYDRQSGE